MNGNRYFLDINAVIALLSGKKAIEERLNQAGRIGISVISILEFLSFPRLSVKDKFLFYSFLERIEIEAITRDKIFLEALAGFKSESNLKLPDAIIAGCAIQRQAILLSKDSHFEGINKLLLQKF